MNKSDSRILILTDGGTQRLHGWRFGKGAHTQWILFYKYNWKVHINEILSWSSRGTGLEEEKLGIPKVISLVLRDFRLITLCRYSRWR